MPEIEARHAGEAVFNLATALEGAGVWKVSEKDATIYRLLGKDLKSCLFVSRGPGDWDALEPTYRQAWLDEIKRRLKGRELQLLNDKSIADETRYVLKKASHFAGSAMPSVLFFSQYKCNAHFQSAYDDSPGWIAGKPLVEVAKKLQEDVDRSVDFRISVSWIGCRWIAWNNRGFTTHCLANVMPLRIVPNPRPSVAEQARLGELMHGINYSAAVPADRRDPGHWESTAPCTVISIVDGGQGTDVLYTVKSGFCRDNGNATVLNTV